MGLASQMILWDEAFCEQLAARGFRVIRFDNRDVGRSTHPARRADVPSSWQLLTRDTARRRLLAGRHGRRRRRPARSSRDRRRPRRGRLDGRDDRPADRDQPSRPRRCRSSRSCRPPATAGSAARSRRWPRRLLRRPPRDREGYIEDHMETYRVIGSVGFDFEEEHKRERAGRCFDRGIHPAGTARQMAAIVTAPDRTDALRQRPRPDDRHPRRRRSAGRRLRRPRDRRGDSRCPARGRPGHGPRSAPRAVAADHRRDRRDRRCPGIASTHRRFHGCGARLTPSPRSWRWRRRSYSSRWPRRPGRRWDWSSTAPASSPCSRRAASITAGRDPLGSSRSCGGSTTAPSTYSSRPATRRSRSFSTARSGRSCSASPGREPPPGSACVSVGSRRPAEQSPAATWRSAGSRSSRCPSSSARSGRRR